MISVNCNNCLGSSFRVSKEVTAADCHSYWRPHCELASRAFIYLRDGDARAQAELEEQKGGYSICRQLFVGTDIGVLWTFSISIAWEFHMRRFGRDERGEEKKIHKQYCPVKIYRSFGRDEETGGAFSRMREGKGER